MGRRRGVIKTWGEGWVVAKQGMKKEMNTGFYCGSLIN